MLFGASTRASRPRASTVANVCASPQSIATTFSPCAALGARVGTSTALAATLPQRKRHVGAASAARGATDTGPPSLLAAVATPAPPTPSSVGSSCLSSRSSTTAPCADSNRATGGAGCSSLTFALTLAPVLARRRSSSARSAPEPSCARSVPKSAPSLDCVRRSGGGGAAAAAAARGTAVASAPASDASIANSASRKASESNLRNARGGSECCATSCGGASTGSAAAAAALSSSSRNASVSMRRSSGDARERLKSLSKSPDDSMRAIERGVGTAVGSCVTAASSITSFTSAAAAAGVGGATIVSVRRSGRGASTRAARSRACTAVRERPALSDNNALATRAVSAATI